MVDAGGGCIGWGARDRDLMRGTVHLTLFPTTLTYIWSVKVSTTPGLHDVPTKPPLEFHLEEWLGLLSMFSSLSILSLRLWIIHLRTLYSPYLHSRYRTRLDIFWASMYTYTRQRLLLASIRRMLHTDRHHSFTFTDLRPYYYFDFAVYCLLRTCLGGFRWMLFNVTVVEGSGCMNH